MSATTFVERMAHDGLRNAIQARGLAGHAEGIVMRSLLNAPRLIAIMDALDKTKSLMGDTAEIGCAGGGTSLMIARLNGGRRHWACDTFDGLADCGEHDDLRNRDFRSKRCTHAIVAERLAAQENLTLLHGYFPECAPSEMSGGRFAFVHIDVDTYRSIHAVFAFFATRMAPGGVVALDDVIGRGTRGAKQAWAEINANPRGRWATVLQNDPQVIVRFS